MSRIALASLSLCAANLLVAQASPSYHITHTYTPGGDGGWDYIVPDASNHRLVDGAGFDPASGNAFASNADGTLTVIHQDAPDSYRVLETVKTREASRNLGLDPTTHAVYIAGAKFEPRPAGAPARQRASVTPRSFVIMVVERR